MKRGNARQTILHKDEDDVAFLRVLREGLERYAVELFAFTGMPNHWHMVLQTSEDGWDGCCAGARARTPKGIMPTIMRRAKAIRTSRVSRALPLPMTTTSWPIP